ncbi:MAG: LacI family DNA-binding transcriptional regulator [Butyricicoccaceae bacterium]
MTIKDIARESGYSVGTVSRVLNHAPGVSETARTKIMAVVEKYHFRLNSNAKQLKQQSSNGIAILVKGTQNMLFADLVEQLQRMVELKGYACMLYYINEDDNELEHAIQVCRERHPVGVLFLGSNQRYFRERFDAIGVPCVLVTNSAASLGLRNLSSVSTDDEMAARFAVEHLISLGHSKIGVLGGKTATSFAAFSRYKGVRAAFAQHNMSFSPQEQYEEAHFSMSEGYRAMERLLQKMPDLTSVFAMSDVMAIGAIRALRDRGLRVPEDISMIGFDGLELGMYMAPRLTTIRQHKESIVQRSIEILLGCIEDKNPAVHEVVPFQFVPGESVQKYSGGSNS